MGSSNGEYKVVGLVKDGDQLEIRTTSRDRARAYAGQMITSSAYQEVQVEIGTQVYSGKEIGGMP